MTRVLAWAARYTTPAPVGAVASAIAFALAQLGKPYQCGATGPGAVLRRVGRNPANPGHVVMYLGADQAIQAPQSGQDVQIDPLDLAGVVVATRPADLPAIS